MGKIKKTRRNKTRASTPYSENSMEVDDTQTEEILNEASTAINSMTHDNESGHALFQRHSSEWKQMKSEVAKLKKERAKLRSKVLSERERKKDISQKIKSLISNLQNKHLDEVKQVHQLKSTEMSLD